MKKTYDDYKKEYIEVMLGGRKYVLIEEAEMYTYQKGFWDITEYSGHAIDKDGNLYYVTWEITEEFERQLEQQGLQYVDEQDACDWENPIAVERV